MLGGHTLSLSRRLTILVALGVLFVVGAVLAMLEMRRQLEERFVERAELKAEGVLLRLDASVPVPASSECSVGVSHAWIGEQPPDVLADLDPRSRARMLAAVATPGTLDLEHGRRGNVPFVIAARSTPAGELRWATVDISEPPALGRWRAVAVGFVILYALLLYLVVETVIRLRRSTRELRDAAVRLGDDLRSPVPEPDVRELGGVAESLRALARTLDTTMSERARLATALAREQRLGALGRIVAAIAHEVRNPLAAIKLRVDLVQEGNGCDEDKRRDIDAIAGEIARLDRLISQLLAHTRSTELEPCSIGALVVERTAALRPWAEARGVAILATGEGTARADRDALARALDNLVRNAVEASPPGGTVHVAVFDDTARSLAIRVDDRGPGVTAAGSAELFEPFFTTKPSGTGLGLSLARATLHSHGGDLTYERHDGRTWFTMRLPRD